MFATHEKLAQRTGKNKPDRSEYLKLLVEEVKTTPSLEMKKQVLANLANFAYDPINYEFLRKLGVLDLFLDLLSDGNVTLKQFAIGGICNLCLDKENKDYIIGSGGIAQIISCLTSHDEETVLSTITTLIFLITPQSKPEITSEPVLRCMLEYSVHPNRRISNLANIFLLDYCTAEQISHLQNVSQIPLPDN